MNKKIKLSDIPSLNKSDLNEVAVNIADKLITNKVGLGWYDVPTNVDIATFVKEGMSVEEFKVAINEAVNSKLVDYDEKTGLFESEKSKTVIKEYEEDEEDEDDFIPGFKFEDDTFIVDYNGENIEAAKAHAVKLGYADLEDSYENEGHIWSHWPKDEIEGLDIIESMNEEFDEDEFKKWMDDGNVEQNEDGTYSTQDAQWKNKLEDMNALKAYYKKEFLSEAVSGEKSTKAAQKGSEKDSKDYLKDATKRAEEFNKPEGNQEYEAVKYEQSAEEEEFVEDIEYGLGQQDLKYDNPPSEKFNDRIEKAVKGDSTMGNKTYTGEWNPATGEGNGNTEPVWGASKEDFGQKVVDVAKRAAKRRDDAEPNVYFHGDDVENSKGSKQPRKTAFAESSIVKLTTKTKIGGLKRAKSIIPESEKKNGNVIIMTDGNETYKFRWDGDNNQAVVMESQDKTKVTESMGRISELMDFKSESNSKSTEDEFKSIMDAARKMEEEAYESVENIDEIEFYHGDDAEDIDDSTWSRSDEKPDWQKPEDGDEDLKKRDVAKYGGVKGDDYMGSSNDYPTSPDNRPDQTPIF